MQIPPTTTHHLYHSIGFRRLRRIVNEAYLASFANSRYPYTSQVDEEWSSRGLSIEDFRVSLKTALDEVVTSRERLASFEPLRNVTEEEEEKFLLTLSLQRKGHMVVNRRKRPSQALQKDADSSSSRTILEKKELLCKMDERVCSFLTSNPAALPMVTDIELRILALYPIGGYISLDSPFEVFLAKGVAQFYGFKSHTSGNDELGRLTLFLENGNIDSNMSPHVYLTSILSSSMESAFR